MIATSDLVHYCNALLDIAQFKDYAPNGLQVEGRNEVSVICSAVTASLDAIKQASILKADVLLVHHGYFWHGEARSVSGMRMQRIKSLLENNINLVAYHLPLDCHVELGNNAQLGALLNMMDVRSHPIGTINNLLWSGSLATTKTCAEFVSWLHKKLQRPPVCVEAGDRPIKKVAWCSGAAQDYLYQAYELGADAYISGEISERTFYEAKELGIHYFSCGHHATERFGLQALGTKLAREFHLEHHFIDSDNPI